MNILIDDLIGDSILQEPSITARAIRDGRPIDVCVKNPIIEELFYGNPWIYVCDRERGKGEDEDCFKLNCVDAFHWAKSHGTYLGAGYFHQLGLEVTPADRVHFLAHNMKFRHTFSHYKEFLNLKPLQLFGYIALAPFGRSCTSPMTGNGNKTAHISWWEQLVRLLGESFPTLSLLSLGGPEDPPLEGTISVRGLRLPSVAGILNYSKLFITIECGLLHLSSHLCRNVIYLNSATDPSLCFPKVDRCTVYRKDRPKDWVEEEVSNITCWMLKSETVWSGI